MKKYGILTFHSADNYGALLQCYAMQEYLKNKGYVEIVNYNPSYFHQKYKVYIPFLNTYKNYKDSSFKFPLLRALRTYCNNIYIFRKFRKKHSFNKFRKKYLNLSEECKTYSKFIEVSNNFDVISVGSDQVWSKRITGKKYDPVFFIQGIRSDIKKISYAASCGGNIPIEDETKIANLLKDFDKISVRETNLAEQLSTVMGKECLHVLDPVFLLDEKQWRGQLVKSNPYSDEKFILVYNVSSESTVKEYFALVDELAKKTGYRIYEIGAKRNTICKGKLFNYVGPEEFVQMVDAAQIVFSTSFHATALSIILRKQFYVFLPGNAKRVTSLLEQLGISDRLIYPGNSIPAGDIDFTRIIPFEQELIKKSKEFIDFV